MHTGTRVLAVGGFSRASIAPTIRSAAPAPAFRESRWHEEPSRQKLVLRVWCFLTLIDSARPSHKDSAIRTYGPMNPSPSSFVISGT